MKKLLSLFLALLLCFLFSISALASEADGDSGGASDASPAAPAESPVSAPSSSPDPDPASLPSPAPDPVSDLAPSPSSDPDPVPNPDSSPPSDPDPDSSPVPSEGGENDVPVENPPLDVADSGISSVGDSLGEPPFDVMETPNGDIIIEEHSYTRTVDILDTSLLEDLPTIRSVLVSIFGEYSPKTQSVATYYDGQLMESSIEYVPGVAGMDMEWIAGVVVFTVLLYCFMKLLGGILK